MNNFLDYFKTGIGNAIPIIAAFFMPSIYIMLMILLLVTVDTVLGIKSARKKKQKITTNRFSDVFAKIIGYAVFLTIGLIVDKSFKLEYAVWISSLIPITTELMSINEKQINMGKKGWLKQAGEVYNFALKIKQKKDKLR